MTRITRYGREMRTTFIATMFIACLVIVIGIPFVAKNLQIIYIWTAMLR